MSRHTKQTGLAAEAAVLDQMQYLEEIAKEHSLYKSKLRRRASYVSDRLERMNRKFQINYWDPTFNKNLVDPYHRGRSKLPACDALCHKHLAYSTDYRDILHCMDEYQRRYEETHDLGGQPIPLQEDHEYLRRKSLFGTLDYEEQRRGITHIKQLKDYDRESEELWTKQAKLMISAAEYINKIKQGRRFPTPPKELDGKRRKKRSKSREGGGETSSARSQGSSIDVEAYLESKAGQGGHENHHRQKWKKRRHFHHNYNSEEFYMEMYLHFLNPEDDVSLKAPPKQMTDIKELRREMNLEDDDEYDKVLIDLLNEASVESLHVVQKKPSSPKSSSSLTQEMVDREKELMEQQLKRLNNPRLTHILTRMLSQISIKSSSITMTSSSGSKKTRAQGEEEEEEDQDQVTTISPDKPPTIPEERMQMLKKQGTPPKKLSADEDDDDLDQMGEIPEHEFKLIMNEIAVSSRDSGSSDNLSSGSSGAEEEGEGEGEGEDLGDDDALKLFKKAKKKKDSLAELMDLTTEFRARVCHEQGNRPREHMNPFAEAVCVLYPFGSDQKKSKAKLLSQKSNAHDLRDSKNVLTTPIDIEASQSKSKSHSLSNSQN